jgi:hypothetical protein
MAFVQKDVVMGEADLTTVDPLGPGVYGTGSGRSAFLGAIVRGYDAVYGEGEFIFLKGVASLAVGDVVEYNGLTGATTRWAGTANTGKPLAIAISAPTASQYGWFQIAGNAVVTCSGTVAAGDSAYFSATASVKSAAAAGKQVLNMIAVLANGGTPTGGTALASTQAVYTIQRPFCQGAIT